MIRTMVVLSLMAVFGVAFAGTRTICGEGTSQRGRRISATHNVRQNVSIPLGRNPAGFLELEGGKGPRTNPIPKFGHTGRKSSPASESVEAEGRRSLEYLDIDANDSYQDLDGLFPNQRNKENIMQQRPRADLSPRDEGSGRKSVKPRPGVRGVGVNGRLTLEDLPNEDVTEDGDVIVIHQEYHQHIMPERERYQYPYNIYG